MTPSKSPNPRNPQNAIIDSIQIGISDNQISIDLYQPTTDSSQHEIHHYIMPVDLARNFSDELYQLLHRLIPGADAKLSIRDSVWNDFESLFGTVSDASLNDAGLDDLRDEWEERLKDIYEAE